MLELRPNCERCDKDLPPDATDALICTYECTFCAACVNDYLKNVCPNCGGGFSARPIRPKTEHKQGLSLDHQPPSDKRIHSQYTAIEIETFSNALKDIKPEHR